MLNATMMAQTPFGAWAGGVQWGLTSSSPVLSLLLITTVIIHILRAL